MEWQSTQDCENNANETAKTMCECVQNWLSNVEKVQKQLKNETDSQPAQCHSVLQFLHHCTEVFPECYVRKHSENDTQDKEVTSKGFTCWIISRLISILVDAKCEAIHKKCIQVIMAILKLVQEKDVMFYNSLGNDLIGMYKDVLKLAEAQCKLESNMFTERIYCNRFMECKDVFCNQYGITQTMIPIDSYEHCRYLLNNLSIIISENLSYFNVYMSNKTGLICELVAKAACLCDPELLENTVLIIGKLGQYVRPFPRTWLLQYINILLGVLEWTINEEKDNDAFLQVIQNTAIVLIKLYKEVDTLSTQFFTKICFLIEKSQSSAIVKHLATILSFAVSQWPTLCQPDVTQVVLKVCMKKLKQQQWSCQGVFESLITSLFSSMATLNQAGDVDVRNTIQEEINHFSGKAIADAANGVSHLRALNFVIKISLKNFSSRDIAVLFNDVNLAEIYESYLTMFQNLPKKVKDRIKDLYIQFMTFLSHLYYIIYIGNKEAGTEVIQPCLELSSLPWLSTIDPPWFDLKVEFFSKDQLFKLHRLLNGSFDSNEVLSRCLDLLLILSQDATCHTWISHVVRNTLANTQLTVHEHLLDLLPEFIFTLKEHGHQMFEDDLLMFVRSASPQLVEKAGSVLHHLICVLTKTVSTDLSKGKLVLTCRICQSDDKNVAKQEYFDGTRSLKPYFQMLRQNTNRKFKHHMANSLVQLVRHVKKVDDITSLWVLVLELLLDSDPDIRYSLCDTLCQLLQASDDASFHKLAIDQISEAFAKASTANDTNVLETLIMTLGNVGMISSDELTSAVVVGLFNCFVTQNKSLASLAADQIQGIARAKNMSYLSLFMSNKSSICNMTVKKVHQALVEGKGYQNVTADFVGIAKLFEFPDVKGYLLDTATEMLPKIVEYASTHSSLLLRLISKESQQSKREMLFHNFKYIFSHLLRTITVESDLENCLRYLQEETQVELGNLLLSEYQSVLNQLILFLSVNREQVYHGFKILAGGDENYHGPKSFTSDDEVAMFLQPKLLGILAFFNYTLINSPIYEKKIALQSLLCLLNIMGKQHLTPVRLKIMAILKLALKYKKDFPETCCEAWLSFVHNIETELLGPLISQIIATVLPLMEYCEEQVLAIINFLIVQNKVAFKQYFKEVYFLPNHPSLKKARSIIENLHCPIDTTKEFKIQLQCAVKAIKSENEDVQKFALMKVSELLEDNSSFLLETLVQSEDVDQSIKELIQTLMHFSKEKDDEIYSIIGKCFGLLGALDIAGIDSLFDYSNENEKQNSIYDEGFAEEILNKLGRSFLAASHTRAQDCAAYAMQETLQYYKCSSEPDHPGYQLWQKFPDSIQELLLPHLRSKYRSTSVYSWSKQQLPIYGGPKGTTYKDWTSNYTSYLIYHLNESNYSKLLKPFLSCLKYDLRMALFLLPHVVLVTLLSGNIASVNTEFKCIVDQVAELTIVPESLNLCLQTFFSVMDFLAIWYKNSEDDKNENIKAGRVHIKKFIDKTPKNKMAMASLNSKSLARSLLYYEEYVNLGSDNVDNHLEFLQKIYYALDEPDGIAGIAATRKRAATVSEKIVEHQSSGNLRGAVACFERAIFTNAEEVKHHQGLLKCLIGLGQLNNASMNVAGIIESRPEWNEELLPFQAEVSWRLGQWGKLKETVSFDTKLQNNWSNSLGKLLCSLKSKEPDQFNGLLSHVRSDQTRALLNANVGSGGFTQAYQNLLRLHMLRDLEACSSLVFKDDLGTNDVTKVLSHWDKRLDITESSYKTRESILYLHQILLQLLPDTQGNQSLQVVSDGIWLKLAKIARKGGLSQTAYSALLNIEDEEREEVIVERANWFSVQKKHHEALLCVQGQTDFTAKNLSAKRILKKSMLMEKTEYYAPTEVLNQYKVVAEKHKTWEKGHFYLAVYYEKLMNNVDEHSKDKCNKRRNDFYKFVIKFYGSSLLYGNKFIYQSMPRLLTHWLDFGQLAHQMIEGEVPDVKQNEISYFKDRMQKIQDEMLRFSQALPAYKFLTVVSQLVSRICHPSKSVWELLKAILCKIFKAYKQQAIWNMVAVYKSTLPMRSSRCKEIFQDIIRSNGEYKAFISHSIELCDMFLTISNQKCGPKDTKLSMRRDFPSLVRMLKNPNLSHIMVPLQETLTVKVSSCSTNGGDHQFDPLPDNLPFICGVDDCVDVLQSLQKPKKIKLKATDGRSYTLMCKPKDDLRKDSRLMEFNSLVNKLLLQDTESRRRQLHIRTYAVIPLNEECGLLEWVPNTSGLRYIVNNIYREKGMVCKVSELKQMYDVMTRESNMERKCEIFKKRVLPKFPPIFHEWFLNTFVSPTKWYVARVAYCRTSAVISMVGYILGLGDRHGENILFDATNGDCVHVDFNCLFNKGEKFDTPERVPFRLTHNMVKAMGALGHEGVFRKSCEHTMKVMRSQKESLLSVLNTFVYDPLVEWKKDTRRAANNEQSTEALKILRNVESRLKGITNKHNMINLSLSIEGQVHHLIKEATDIENLCPMYIGWAAYL